MQTQALPSVHPGGSRWLGPAATWSDRPGESDRFDRIDRLDRIDCLDQPECLDRLDSPPRPVLLRPVLLRPVLLRRARLAALAVGGFLLPWCVVLAITLPGTAHAQHWALAWVGLDGAEALAALVTAALLSRAATRVAARVAALPAAATGTLLLIDAWFDICTSAPGAAQAMSLAEAVFVEVPLAVAAWWLAIVLNRDSR